MSQHCIFVTPSLITSSDTIPNPDNSMKSRLIGLCASLFFSVPTAALLWLSINRQLTYVDGGFLNSNYLLGCISIFALISFVLPQLFPSVLGWVWRMMLKIGL